MWPFGKRKAEAVKKEAEALVSKILNDALVRYKLETSGDMATGIKTEFVEMNNQIMKAFDKAQQTGETNSESIAILAQSVTNLIQAFNSLQERVYMLESQLSVTGVKFSKGTSN
jgi:hypothetical protein